MTVVFAVLKSATKQTTKGCFLSPTRFSIAQCINKDEILDLFMHHGWKMRRNDGTLNGRQ